jgi:hypothetical protein
MSDSSGCDCDELSSNDGWIRWLDRRNMMRAAWVVLSTTGALSKYASLACSIYELREKSKFENIASSGHVTTKAALWDWASSDKTSSHVLGRLPKDALEKFISGVKFDDYTYKGQRYAHVAGFFYGDLLHEYGFNFSDLFEVFALFGMAPEFAVMSSDKFGWDVENSKCQARPAFTCPYSADC